MEDPIPPPPPRDGRFTPPASKTHSGFKLRSIFSFLLVSQNDDHALPSSSSRSNSPSSCLASSSSPSPSPLLVLSEPFPLESLPEEIVLKVLSFLPANDILAVERSTHDLNRLCNESRLWRKIAGARWDIVERKKNMDWRGYYLLKTFIPRAEPYPAKWTKVESHRNNWPTKRYQHSATTVGRKIYYIGGQESQTRRFDDIFEFDTANYTFKRIIVKGESQPPRFARHTAIAIGMKIFIFGGFDGMSTYYELSIFDTETLTWSNPEVKGTPPRARTNHAAAAIGKDIYMFGGITRDTSGVLQDLDEFYVLETDTLTWRKEDSLGLPAPRCGHRLLVVAGKLYLFGGGAGDSWLHKFNDIHVYDPELHEWTRPQCIGSVDVCTFSSVFVLGTFIFVFGGQLIAKGEVCNLLYAFDTLTYTWHTIETPQPIPPARDMASVSVVGTRAYLFGGYNGKPLDDMHVFSLNKHLQQVLEDMEEQQRQQNSIYAAANKPLMMAKSV